MKVLTSMMPSFAWTQTSDDWDAPMLAGVAGKTTIRLDTRQRLWLVNGPGATLGKTRDRLMEALGEFTHEKFTQGFTEDHHSLVVALTSLHWGLAALGTRNGGSSAVMTSVRHGHTWLNLFTRSEATQSPTPQGWLQVHWPMVMHLLGEEAELAGVIINPFEKNNVLISRHQCLSIGGVGCAVRLQQDIELGLFEDRPLHLLQSSERVSWQSAAVVLRGRFRDGSRVWFELEIGHFENKPDTTLAKVAHEALAAGAGVVLTTLTGKRVAFSAGELATLLEPFDSTRDFVEFTAQQIDDGLSVRVLALNEEMPDGLQKGIASEGVTKLNLVQSTHGRCLIMHVPMDTNLEAIKFRLHFWLKPYYKYLLQVEG